jgi:hypothetical protein
MTILAANSYAFAAAAVVFRASPDVCANLIAANGSPRRPSVTARADRVTRDEIAALFAADLYARA